MTKKAISHGTVHSVPADLPKVLISDWPRGQNGRILRPSRAMSGSAGLSPSRNRKPEGSTLSVYARNLKKECAGLVAGPAVLTAEIKTAYLYSTSSSSHSHGAVPLFQYRRAERLLTRQVSVNGTLVHTSIVGRLWRISAKCALSNCLTLGVPSTSQGSDEVESFPQPLQLLALPRGKACRISMEMLPCLIQ